MAVLVNGVVPASLVYPGSVYMWVRIERWPGRNDSGEVCEAPGYARNESTRKSFWVCVLFHGRGIILAVWRGDKESSAIGAESSPVWLMSIFAWLRHRHRRNSSDESERHQLSVSLTGPRSRKPGLHGLTKFARFSNNRPRLPARVEILFSLAEWPAIYN